MSDLFEYAAEKSEAGSRPLAERMRPVNLKEFVGQQELVGKDTPIRNAIENDRIFSMILWGPPGCGKTTLARIVAGETKCHFVQFSAVLAGVNKIRSVIEEAREQLRLFRKRTILFVDEIHRFNKSQQDAFLQHVESGLITLIGATTENPSFEVISALMSRCRVVTLSPLSREQMTRVLERALADGERGLGKSGFKIDKDAMAHLVDISDGDVRSALNGLEIAVTMADFHVAGTGVITLEAVEKALSKRALIYDKGGDGHYNLISALHKSLRGSDPDAAIYWLGRMLAAGEDPIYVARRMIRFASEDVGNADPHALGIALSGLESYRLLGPPEGELALVQTAVYLATAPKSNSLYTAYGRVKEAVARDGSLPVPLHIRNAPTSLMKDLGYGKNYKYAHDFKGAFTPQEHLPDALSGTTFYHPTERGYEKTIKHRLDGWRRLKAKKEDS
jgi:putative ATPase